MVSQCCCGCSLRTGTLILLWLSVILGVFTPISNLMKFSNDGAYDKMGAGPFDKQIIKIHLLLSSMTAIVGLVTAIFGINAINKNKAKYLEPFLFYYGLEMVYGVLFLLVALFNPKIFLSMMSPETLHELRDGYAVFGFLGSLIGLGLWAYFWVVIRSCRDSMLENAAGNNARAATNSFAPPAYCDNA